MSRLIFLRVPSSLGGSHRLTTTKDTKEDQRHAGIQASVCGRAGLAVFRLKFNDLLQHVNWCSTTEWTAVDKQRRSAGDAHGLAERDGRLNSGNRVRLPGTGGNLIGFDTGVGSDGFQFFLRICRRNVALLLESL